MIGFLRGRLAARGADGCLVDVGGVGYRVHCSAATLASLPPEGAEVRLYTHTHVREDALALFGFSTEAEQRMFELLIGVSGVGPRVALSVCGAFSPEELRRTLVAGDAAALAAVPGIGKKTAQRILLDLKEKLALPDLEVVSGAPDLLAQARSALENLGYSPAEVREALQGFDPAPGEEVGDVVRRALRELAARRRA